MRAQITAEDLTTIRDIHRNRKIVFCSGGFDLTHAGHAIFLEDCKRHGDILVVGVAGDVTRKQGKGDGRPIVNEHMRLKLVASLKPVDYAFIIYDLPTDHQLDPLIKIMNALRPHVYVVNNDASHIPYREELAKSTGSKLVILDRTCPPEYENVSTTSIIEKIKKLEV